VIRLFRVLVPTSVAALLLSEIVLVVACYVAAFLVTPGIVPRVYLVDEANHWKILLIVAVIILGFYFQDLYTELRILSRILLVQEVCLSVGAALLLMAVLGYVNTDYLLPRETMVLGSFAVILCVPVWRIVYWKYVIRALRHERVLLLGGSEFLAETARHILERPQLGYQIVGYLSECAAAGFPVRYLGQVSALARIFEQYRPTRIIVGMAERTDHLPMLKELLEIHFAGVVIEDAADTYEMAAQRVCTSRIRAAQLVLSPEFGPRQKALATQSVYSVLFGLCGLLCTLPVMAIVALAIKVTSQGPVFYRQRRVGMNGRIFTLYKFRSMYRNAEAATGAVWAKKNDPRITPVGRFLRKLRLDELPQFWNVVKGDMSIVGPRPERPEFVEMLAERVPYYRQRHAVKPGITGWAQINHKYGDTDGDAVVKLEYDLYYIKHIAPALDLFIVFHTLKVMLLQRGAQ
jgi:exopolysaccharide biosynthesis polyprenyl glycosylphosphotransferase